MEAAVRSIILSFMMGISCKEFFEVFVPHRKWRYQWMEHMSVFVFAGGMLWIAFSKIPPYIFQPVRLIAVVAVAAGICFQVKAAKNLVLSVFFCSIYWILWLLLLSVVYVLPITPDENTEKILEVITQSLDLCVVLFLGHKFKNRVHGMAGGRKWAGLAFFPVFGMIVLMAISMMPWDGSPGDKYAKLAAVFGFAVIGLCIFYYVVNLMEKETEMQKMRLLQARTQNQMDMYRSMQKNYEQQRRYLHDYKNQLNCISGMISAGEAKEALAYISRLTGSLKKSTDYVNTNHRVVNIVLNQKYHEACEKGITMTMAINDLSGLTMSEEEIVILLVNLIDNAIEACAKLEHNKVIQFKMLLEDGQLICSIRNPAAEPVHIKGKLVSTSKKNVDEHGIGLMNVDAVVRKNGGTSILKYEDGWFYFSAMFAFEEES